MTFHKRGRGPARRYEMDAEKGQIFLIMLALKVENL